MEEATPEACSSLVEVSDSDDAEPLAAEGQHEELLAQARAGYLPASALVGVIRLLPGALARAVRPKVRACAKWGALLALRRFAPRQFLRVACASVAAGVADVLLGQGRGFPVPAPVRGTASIAASLLGPVLTICVVEGAKLLWPSNWRERQRAKQYASALTGANDRGLMRSSSGWQSVDSQPSSTGRSNVDSASSQVTPVATPHGARPSTALAANSHPTTNNNTPSVAQLTLEHRDELDVLARMLADRGVRLPRGRSHPAQLMRFMISNGILQAKTPAQRVAALKDTAAHLQRHSKWFSEMHFLQPHELRKWHPFCRVAGLHQGTVVLELFVGNLIQQKTFQECQKFPKAVVSLMELVLKKLMAEDGTKPSQLTTLLHVGDVTLVDSMKFLRIGTAMAVAMNKNYPCRLAKMYVVDLPVSAQWFLQAVLRFVSPVTRRKVVTCSSKDRAALPTPSGIVRASAAASSARRPRPRLAAVSVATQTPAAWTAPQPRPPPTTPRAPQPSPVLTPRQVADSVSSSPSHAKDGEQPDSALKPSVRRSLSAEPRLSAASPARLLSLPQPDGAAAAGPGASVLAARVVSESGMAAGGGGERGERPLVGGVRAHRSGAVMWHRLRSLKGSFKGLSRRARHRHGGSSPPGDLAPGRLRGSLPPEGLRPGVCSHKLPMAACRSDDSNALVDSWTWFAHSMRRLLGNEGFEVAEGIALLVAIGVLYALMLCVSPQVWDASVRS